MKAFLEKIISFFLVLCITFIPLNFDGKGIQFKISRFLFHDLIKFIQSHFFKNAIKNVDFSSDTIGLNLLICFLFFVSILVVFVLDKLKFKRLQDFSRIIVVYYLIYILLKYGFDKIFKSQFYLPEPNILSSKFGDLSRDILYWSTIGTSRFYSVSLGIIEAFTAVLLIINRTRVLGLLIAIRVFLNVILINLGFDVSVKTFSILLLIMSIYSVFPDLKTLFDFLVLRKKVQLIVCNSPFIKHKPILLAFKFFVVGLIFIQILLPYFESQNFNDDNSSRPFLHGNYQVIYSNQKPSKFNIKHFYIHRKNYLILENEKSEKIDYYFENNLLKKQLILINYKSKTEIINYQYNPKDSVLQLNFLTFKIISKAQNWRKSEALKDQFHWTIDEI